MFLSFLRATQSVPSLDVEAGLAQLREATAQLSADATGWARASLVDVVVAIVASVMAVAALIGARYVLRRVLGQVKEGSLRPQHIAARLVAHTHTAFLVIAGCSLVTPFAVEPPSLVQALRLAFVVAGVIQGAIWAREVLIAVVEHQAARRQGDDSAFASAVGILSWMVNLIVWSIALLLILDNLGVNVTALVAGLGIGGIAAGLAAQGIMSDLFSAISILMDRPFVRGDFIVFGDAMGEVEKIGLKTTRIRALSGEQIIVSNAKLLSQEIHNHRRMTERRVQFAIEAAMESPSDKVAQIPRMLKEAVLSAPRVRFARAHLLAFQGAALKFEVVYYVLSRDYDAYMDAHQTILLAILKRFEDEGLSFANGPRLLRVVAADAKTEESASDGKPQTTETPAPRLDS